MPGFTAGFVRPSDYLPGCWPGALSRSFGALYWDSLPSTGPGWPMVLPLSARCSGVVSGLIQVLLSSGRPVLRRGETLLASRRGIDGWRNMGEGDAQCLWVLRD
jgi:hypothetical protein